MIDSRTPSLPGTIRVALAEDHGMVRAGPHPPDRRSRTSSSSVSPRTVTRRRSWSRCANPDVLLLDITMPRLGGLGVLGRVVADYPATRVIMLSMHDNEEYVGPGAQGRRPRLPPEGFGPRRARARDPLGDARRLVLDSRRLPPGHPRLHVRTDGGRMALRSADAAPDRDRPADRRGSPQCRDRRRSSGRRSRPWRPTGRS